MQPSRSKRWQIGAPVPSEVNQALEEYHPILRRALFNRHILQGEAARRYLNAEAPNHSPSLLKDMDAAVDRLLYAIDHQEAVAVYGDYDVDGVTATVLITQVLRELGANVRPYIPNRFEEGYGLNNDALDTLQQSGVRVVVTVDCGVRSSSEVEHGREIGLDMIITDHHAPLGDLPPACAVVCQRQEGDTYPDKNLAGVGLAFKLAQALIASREASVPVSIRAEDWLDLVALGTVADVVPLVGENRYLVRAGLERIRQGQRQGLLSLMNVAGIDYRRCGAGDIGFALGPRLNAAGRLESALAAVNLLLCDEADTAGPLAQVLDNQNRARQELTRSMHVEAEKIAMTYGDDHLLCAFSPDFNSGVVGLVAARLTESYYRPSMVGYRGEEFTRASCRSIDEFHITQALDECRELMVRHGGHAKAAGFTVRNENLDELVARMKAIALQELGERDLRPVLRADMEVSLSDLRPDVIFPILEKLEPTGLDNPEMVFVSRNLRPTWPKSVGADGSHLRMNVTNGNLTFSVIAFRQGHWVERLPERVDILYTFERNVYNGRESLQLNVRDIKPTGSPD